MFVELGSSADLWRAHIVRGVLATHGIEAVLWHEHAVHIYGPGWGPHGILLVSEDDVEGAIEILRARPEPMPELEEQSDTVIPADRFPGLGASILTGMILLTTLALIETALHFLTHLFEHAASRYAPLPRDVFSLPPPIVPIAGLCWGILCFVMSLPLRVIKRGPWMALFAYLWVRVLIWIVGIALAACVL